MAKAKTTQPGLVVTDAFINAEDNRAFIALWITRILQDSFYRKRIESHDGYRNLSGLDFAMMLDVDAHFEEEADFKEALAALAPYICALNSQLEKSNLSFKGPLGDNLRAISAMLNLTDVEQALLGFYSLLQTVKKFENFTDFLGDLSRQELVNVLSVTVKQPRLVINNALNRAGRLHQAGLLKVDKSSANDLRRKVDLLDGFADLVTAESQAPLDLLSRYFVLSAQSHLTLDNYPHLKEQTQTVLDYLKNQTHKTGINILVHGEPGTGKTQWIKALAQQLKTPLFEIVSEDEDGDGVTASRRIDVYKLAQSALAHQGQCLMMFDEVEDVFPTDNLFSLFGSSRQRSSNSKAWINQLLETNPVPTFWVSNAVRQIDAAYLRRFDIVIELSNPPRSVRRGILTDLFAHLPVKSSWLDELAKQPGLVPAVIERAVKVSKTLHNDTMTTQQFQDKVLSLVNATLQAQGKKEIQLKNLDSKLDYSLQYLNTDVNLDKLVNGIKQRQQGRFCLYGLPGTGKTAFGHYLAEQLDKPLLIKRASDLLSPYVGEAEQNIAYAFKEAQREGAVLQIDEADSFLQSRENAVRSWEVTQVNEMLTQMEAFEGVFIASTNLVKNLDAAAMRRFDVKMEFKPLKPDQAWWLFQALFKEGEFSQNELEQIKQQLSQLSLLTPGDFAAVKRKFSLGYQDFEPGLVLQALSEECSYKPGYAKQNGIGFMSGLSVQ
ncbi:MAG: ATP-binding protein [Thiomicrospira sp.]